MLAASSVTQTSMPENITTPQTEPVFEALPELTAASVTLYDPQTGKVLEYSQEDYVTGVVLSEMPVSFGHEALRAQAIACRTYALYNILRGREHPYGAQLCTDPAHCQAFCTPENASEEKLLAVKSAVQSTAGEIMLYDGAPILAVFHASSGKKTKSSAEVWGGELNYLVSVETPEWQINDGVINKNYTFSVQEFSSRIRTLCELSGLSDQQIANSITVQKADSGKVTGVSVCGEFIGGTAFANALGLRTSDFDVFCDGKNITVTCYGYGHGVGLSQYGAREMARQGANCYDILSHYYSGITFSKTSGV